MPNESLPEFWTPFFSDPAGKAQMLVKPNDVISGWDDHSLQSLRKTKGCQCLPLMANCAKWTRPPLAAKPKSAAIATWGSQTPKPRPAKCPLSRFRDRCLSTHLRTVLVLRGH